MSSDLFNPFNLIAMLVILYLGLLANSVSTAVWVTQVKVRAGAFLLCCLCITDALFCLTLSILVLLQLTQLFNIGCYAPVILLPFSVFGNASRLWTVVLMAHRWVAVSRPFAVARLCSLRRQVLIVTCLLLLPLTFLAKNIYAIHITSTYCQRGLISSDKLTFFFVYIPWLLPSWNILLAIAILVLGFLLLYSTCTIRKAVGCKPRSRNLAKIPGREIQRFTQGWALWRSTAFSSLCFQVPTSHPDNANRHWQRVAKRNMTVLVLCMAAFSLMETLLFLFIIIFIFALDVVANAYIWVTIVNCSINFLLYSCFGRDFRSILRRQWTACWTRSPTSPTSSRITTATTAQQLSVLQIEN